MFGLLSNYLNMLCTSFSPAAYYISSRSVSEDVVPSIRHGFLKESASASFHRKNMALTRTPNGDMIITHDFYNSSSTAMKWDFKNEKKLLLWFTQIGFYLKSSSLFENYT